MAGGQAQSESIALDRLTKLHSNKAFSIGVVGGIGTPSVWLCRDRGGKAPAVPKGIPPDRRPSVGHPAIPCEDALQHSLTPLHRIQEVITLLACKQGSELFTVHTPGRGAPAVKIDSRLRLPTLRVL
jgi:hypothetical protein